MPSLYIFTAEVVGVGRIPPNFAETEKLMVNSVSAQSIFAAGRPASSALAEQTSSPSRTIEKIVSDNARNGGCPSSCSSLSWTTMSPTSSAALDEPTYDSARPSTSEKTAPTTVENVEEERNEKEELKEIERERDMEERTAESSDSADGKPIEVGGSKDFGFLSIPRNLRYNSERPFKFTTALNICFGFGSTFSVSYIILWAVDHQLIDYALCVCSCSQPVLLSTIIA